MNDCHSIIPASYLILIKDNKILLSKRKNTGYKDGEYSLVAGHVESGETFTQAMIREAKEEANIEIKASDLEITHIAQRDSGMDFNNERIDVFFTTKKWSGEIKNNEPNKCSDLSWFDLDKLPKETVDYIREVIQNVKNKKFYSEIGF